MKRFQKWLVQMLILGVLASTLTGCAIVPVGPAYVPVPVPIVPWYYGHHHRW